MFRKNMCARIYNLLHEIQNKHPKDETLMTLGEALMNVATDYKYTSISNYVRGEKRQVLHTDAAHPLLPGMSSLQVKNAWSQHIAQSGSTNNPTVADVTNKVNVVHLMKWEKCPELDDAAKKMHLLMLTVNKQVATSIHTGNFEDDTHAKMLHEFLKTINPHWIASPGNIVLGSSAVFVLSSMTLHQACQQENAPNSKSNLPHVKITAAEKMNKKDKSVSNEKVTGDTTVATDAAEKINKMAKSDISERRQVTQLKTQPWRNHLVSKQMQRRRLTKKPNQ